MSVGLVLVVYTVAYTTTRCFAIWHFYCHKTRRIESNVFFNWETFN